MRTLIITIPPLLTLVAYTTGQPRFPNMSEMELIRYNRTVPYLDEVYCSEEMSIGSHIRERSCGNKRDIIEGRTGSLGNPSSSISVAR